MILTNQQKYIVEVLKQLKYLRVRQLHAMIQAHYGPQGVEIGEHFNDVFLLVGQYHDFITSFRLLSRWC